MNQVPRKHYEQVYVYADLFKRLTSCPATQNRDLLRVASVARHRCRNHGDGTRANGLRTWS
jgi:hypothetical protein